MTLLILAIVELSKRNSLFGALIASLPVTSIIAMLWLYVDEKNVEKVAALSNNIFWLVIPSLVFFVCLPILLKKGIHFYLSMGLSMSVTVGCYFAMMTVLSRYGGE